MAKQMQKQNRQTQNREGDTNSSAYRPAGTFESQQHALYYKNSRGTLHGERVIFRVLRSFSYESAEIFRVPLKALGIF